MTPAGRFDNGRDAQVPFVAVKVPLVTILWTSALNGGTFEV